MSVKTLDGEELMVKAVMYLFEIGDNINKYKDDITETVTYTLAPTTETEEMEIEIPLHKKKLLVDVNTLEATVKCPFPVMGVIITLYEEDFPKEFKFRLDDDPSEEIFSLKKEERCQCQKEDIPEEKVPLPEEDTTKKDAESYSTISIRGTQSRITFFTDEKNRKGLEKIEVTLKPAGTITFDSPYPEYKITFKGKIEEHHFTFKDSTPLEVYSYEYLILDVYNEYGEKGMYLLKKDSCNTFEIVDKTSDIGLTDAFDSISSSRCTRLYSEEILFCDSHKLWIANAWGIKIRPTDNYTWESFFKRMDSLTSSVVSRQSADARDVESNPYLDRLIMSTIKYPIADTDKERYIRLVENKLNIYNVDGE